ncbi:MAG: hypothetical protein AB1611_02870 [bacterium]
MKVKISTSIHHFSMESSLLPVSRVSSAVLGGFVLLVHLFFPVRAGALPSMWQVNYGGKLDDSAQAVQQTSDGGYIVVGWTRSFGGDQDCYIIKLNSNGEEVWPETKRYGGKGNQRANAVVQTSNGGYIIAGVTDSTESGMEDCYLIRLDRDGNRVGNDKTYGGSSDDSANSIQKTSDGNYIIAGSTKSFGGQDCYIVKFDSNLQEIWSRHFGTDGNDSLNFIQETSDQGFIAAGWTQSFEGSNRRSSVVKLGSDGSVNWYRTFGGGIHDAAYSVAEISGVGYLVAGVASSPPTGDNCYVRKLDKSGSFIWEKTYGGSGDDAAYSLQLTSDGGYVLAGEKSSSGTNGKDCYCVKVDYLGDTAWEKTYGWSGDDICYCIQPTKDGGYVLAGATLTAAYGLELYIIKTDSKGNTTARQGGPGGSSSRNSPPSYVNPDQIFHLDSGGCFLHSILLTCR